jgi:hypothetical protein
VVDPSGSAYVTGHTGSGDFPTTPGAYDTTLGGPDHDAFLVRLDPPGSVVLYGSYLGGTLSEESAGIDRNGTSVFIAGGTSSLDFPTATEGTETRDPEDGWRALAWLERHGHLDPTLRVEPQSACACGDGRTPGDGGEPELPALFAAYLRYGARVLGPPAIDRAFKTVDFLVLLDVAALSPLVLRRFGA